MASALLAGLIAAVALASAPAPAPGDEPLPRTTAGYVSALEGVRPPLRAAARAWDGTGAVPDDLAAYALFEQRLALALADRPRLYRRVLTRLSATERAGVRDEVTAQTDLASLSRGWPVKRRYRTGPAEPAAALWRFYGRGHRRFRVSRSLLAAVNFVESDFNRLRSDSVADAQGPMQFIASTWRTYGLGGDVRDPRDAILGAANYLHANGAPGDDARSLYHYNPSRLYVDAVRRYGRRMRTEAGFRAFYARSLFVRAAGGGHRRLTGPGG
ncbi:MAG: transglycosylase SLT domain-containing protein [Solirubrobacteraceae bacterium]